MSQGEDGNRFLGIANVADDAVVADAVSPQPFFLTAQRFAKLVRIGGFSDSFAEIADEFSLDLLVEFLELLFGGAGDLNAPSQGGAPVV